MFVSEGSEPISQDLQHDKKEKLHFYFHKWIKVAILLLESPPFQNLPSTPSEKNRRCPLNQMLLNWPVPQIPSSINIYKNKKYN